MNTICENLERQRERNKKYLNKYLV